MKNIIAIYTGWMRDQYVRHDYRLMWELWLRFTKEVEVDEPKDLWAECVAMAKDMSQNFEIILRHGFYFMSYPMFESDCLTLEELHAKLTELTKG